MPEIPDVVQAKAFQLVDDNGQVRAEMKTNEHGDPSFVLLDRDGKARFDLSFLEDGGLGLHLNDTNGQAGMSVKKSGEPYLSLWDQGGGVSLVASADRGGESGLFVFDCNGCRRLSANMFEDILVLNCVTRTKKSGLARLGDSGEPDLSLFDRSSKARISAAVSESGQPELTLRDQEEQHRLSANLNGKGNPSLFLYDESGRKQLILGTDRDYDRLRTLLEHRKVYPEGFRHWFPGLYILDEHGQDRFAAGCT